MKERNALSRRRFIQAALAGTAAVGAAPLSAGDAQAKDAASAANKALAGKARWWKGNLHTHSLWSDGDDFPEMVAEWYKDHGYHFLSLSDHNILSQADRWVENKDNIFVKVSVALPRYLKRFGPEWVEQREENGKRMVRLKPLREFRALLEEPGRFLLMQNEEISDRTPEKKPEKPVPIHFGAPNLLELIPPPGGQTALEVMQNISNAVLEQRQRTGIPMAAILNHPNFRWALTLEEMLQLDGTSLFELYNGHPSVNNEGDATRPSTERMWDVILTKRLAELGKPPIFGVATDDAHHFLGAFEKKRANPGRGWVVVRACALTPEHLLTAMETGDFYASTGVELKALEFDGQRIKLAIRPRRGVKYVTRFIGTRKGYDPKPQPQEAPNPPKYSSTIGEVLAEVEGLAPSYAFKGDEIYVRAQVTVRRTQGDGASGAAEPPPTAWTQPFIAKKG